MTAEEEKTTTETPEEKKSPASIDAVKEEESTATFEPVVRFLNRNAVFV